jgi:carbon-monoxide dehydrogenase large subunit
MKPAEAGALAQSQRWIGRPLRRVEDRPLVVGEGRFVDDLAPPGCLHAVFARSPVARARIAAVRTDAARGTPGVVAVVTGDDLGALESLSVNRVFAETRVPPHPLLARAAVNSVGEPVAMVVAETLAAARDAAERVEVDYESLDPVVRTAAAAGADTLFAELPDNEAFRHQWRVGDVEAAFGAATQVVSVRIEQPRVAAVPLEPRATLASWDAGAGELTVWTSTQTPHRARTDLARILGLDAARVRAIAPDVGGAFGAKASLYAEDAVVAWASLRLGRPVKWAALRSEDLVSATHGRGAAMEAELAVAGDGALLGLRARLVFPLGRWLPYSAVVPAWNAARILPGPYRIDAVDITARGVVTNAAAVGIYRGAGRPEAAMLMERLLDEAAHALGLDPLELRRRNVIPADRFPYRTPTGQVLDSGDYGRALERALELADYAGLRAEQARRRASGELVGIGAALYVEPCGQGWESARVAVRRDGTVAAQSGSSAQGQGQRTAFAQIVAEHLGVGPDRVEIGQGDTGLAPPGIGALASRSTAIGGSALARAAQEVREQGRRIAARLLDAAPEETLACEGGFEVAGSPTRHADWAAVAVAADGAGLESTAVFTAPGEAWSFGCCIAAVAIDAETGALAVERFVWVDDAGVIVNPLLADGQLVGGFAQGLGQALMERIVYDADGQLLTGTLMDYALPRADDVPAVTIEKTVTPSPANAIGAKGVGESGSIGAPPALANAAVDALSPRGIRDLELPLTSYAIWQALHARRTRQEARP